MGMRTSLRFKGTVKEQFLKNFENIALAGEWHNASDKNLKKFSSLDRARLIPTGEFAYMPIEWADEKRREYNENTGEWVFTCSLKDYDDTVEEFFKLVPYFIKDLEYAEVYSETYNHLIKYELNDGVVTKIILPYRGIA